MKDIPIFAAALVLVAASCATAPLESAGSASPRPRAEAASPREAAPPAGPLSLEELIQEALSHNPGIAVKERERDAARARHATARAERMPAVDAVGNVRRTLDDQRLLPPRGPTDPGAWADDVLSAGLVLRLPLYTGGRLTSEIRAADLLAEAAGHRLARTRKELVFNVASLHASILAQRRVIDAVRFSRRTLTEHLKRVNDLIEADRAARIDRLRTEVRLADVRQRLVVEENRLATQRLVLGNLLGREGAVEVRGDLSAETEPPDLAASVASSRDRRADRRAAVAEVEALRHRIEAARAGGRASVFLDGSYGGRWAFSGTNRMPGASPSEDTGEIGITVDVPLFTGGRVSGRVRERRELLAAARESLRSLDLRIRLEVETAVLAVNAARARVEATRDAVAQARESLKIEREKYELGEGSITDVLDAQSAMLDAETNYDLALAELATSRARLELATGGM